MPHLALREPTPHSEAARLLPDDLDDWPDTYRVARPSQRALQLHAGAGVLHDLLLRWEHAAWSPPATWAPGEAEALIASALPHLQARAAHPFQRALRRLARRTPTEARQREAIVRRTLALRTLLRDHPDLPEDAAWPLRQALLHDVARARSLQMSALEAELLALLPDLAPEHSALEAHALQLATQRFRELGYERSVRRAGLLLSLATSQLYSGAFSPLFETLDEAGQMLAGRPGFPARLREYHAILDMQKWSHRPDAAGSRRRSALNGFGAIQSAIPARAPLDPKDAQQSFHGLLAVVSTLHQVGDLWPAECIVRALISPSSSPALERLRAALGPTDRARARIHLALVLSAAARHVELIACAEAILSELEALTGERDTPLARSCRIDAHLFLAHSTLELAQRGARIAAATARTEAAFEYLQAHASDVQGSSWAELALAQARLAILKGAPAEQVQAALANASEWLDARPDGRTRRLRADHALVSARAALLSQDPNEARRLLEAAAQASSGLSLLDPLPATWLRLARTDLALDRSDLEGAHALLHGAEVAPLVRTLFEHHPIAWGHFALLRLETALSGRSIRGEPPLKTLQRTLRHLETKLRQARHGRSLALLHLEALRIGGETAVRTFVHGNTVLAEELCVELERGLAAWSEQVPTQAWWPQASAGIQGPIFQRARLLVRALVAMARGRQDTARPLAWQATALSRPAEEAQGMIGDLTGIARRRSHPLSLALALDCELAARTGDPELAQRSYLRLARMRLTERNRLSQPELNIAGFPLQEAPDSVLAEALGLQRWPAGRGHLAFLDDHLLGLFAFVITGADPPQHSPKAALSEAPARIVVHHLLDALRTRRLDRELRRQRIVNWQARRFQQRLARLLIEPLASSLAQVRHLSHEADGISGQVPWALLAAPDQPTPALGRAYPWLPALESATRSASLFQAAADRSAPRESEHPMPHPPPSPLPTLAALLVGPDRAAPNLHPIATDGGASSRREAREVWRHFEHLVEDSPAQALHIAGSELTRAAVLAALRRQPPLVHFVTRTSREPGPGGPRRLLLRGQESLDPRTIAAMDLSGVGLVVLSGCEGLQDSSGVRARPTGLADAFRRAGVRWVIASHEDVRGQVAATFMRLLYEELALSPRDPAEALLRAQHRDLAAWWRRDQEGAPRSLHRPVGASFCIAGCPY